jgi:uncharacterized protein VirK/YbjX
MKFEHLRWLWTNSGSVCEGTGFIVATRRIRFFVKAMTVYRLIRPMLETPRERPLGRLLEHRPETVGAIIWPYQCGDWDVQVRLDRIRDHYAVIEEIGGGIDFSVDGKLSLLDLSEISEGLHVVVDQPKWLLREGQLAINLFIHDLRIYSLVFSLFHQNGEIAAFVGGIQGSDVEGALDTYREITRAAHGMRPRDLLIETLRMLCVELGVSKIFATTDGNRVHRHRYFGSGWQHKISANYDEIWADRGGVRVNSLYYELDVVAPAKDVNTIPAKKRGMYRHRFEMLGRLKSQTHDKYKSFGNAALAAATRSPSGAEALNSSNSNSI